MMTILLTLALVMTSWTAVEASYFSNQFTHECFDADLDPLEKNMVEGVLIPDEHDDEGYGHKSVCRGDKYALTKFKINITDYHGETQEETCTVNPLKTHANFVVCNLEDCDSNKHKHAYSRVTTRCVPTVQPIFLKALCIASEAFTTTMAPMTTTVMRKKRSVFHASRLFKNQFNEPFFNTHDFPDFGTGGGYGGPQKPRKTTTPGPPLPKYRFVTLDLPTFCSCKFFDC